MRCAIIGLGRIASLLEDDALREKPCTHAGAIAANPEALLVGGCDHNRERRALFGRRWNCRTLAADPDELLAACRPQLVVVATPPASHRRLVETAARHGAAVVICEKPIAPSLPAARAIVRLQRRLRIVVNHERRYSQDYLQMRSLLRHGELGRPLSFRATLFFGRSARLDRVLLHDGTHLVDAIAFLLGDRVRPLGVHSSSRGLRSRRGSAFIAARAAAVPGIIEIGAERDHLVFELEVSLTQGRIRIGNGVYSVEASHSSPHYEGYRSLLPTDKQPPRRTNYFSGMLADALRCVGEPDYQPVSNASTALQALEFISRGRRMR